MLMVATVQVYCYTLILILLIFVDINECVTDNGNCSHDCTNTPGSYLCSCNNGYSIDTDGHSCSGNYQLFSTVFPLEIDINECNTNNGGCDHNCINTIGSYQCQCREGYETNNNGINCTGILFIAYYQLLFYVKRH